MAKPLVQGLNLAYWDARNEFSDLILSPRTLPALTTTTMIARLWMLRVEGRNGMERELFT